VAVVFGASHSHPRDDGRPRRFSREEPAQTLERWIALPTGSPFPGLESEQITMKNGNDVLSQVFPDGEFLMFFMWTGFH
jgi:hypothetical protein